MERARRGSCPRAGSRRSSHRSRRRPGPAAWSGTARRRCPGGTRRPQIRRCRRPFPRRAPPPRHRAVVRPRPIPGTRLRPWPATWPLRRRRSAWSSRRRPRRAARRRPRHRGRRPPRAATPARLAADRRAVHSHESGCRCPLRRRTADRRRSSPAASRELLEHAVGDFVDGPACGIDRRVRGRFVRGRPQGGQVVPGWRRARRHRRGAAASFRADPPPTRPASVPGSAVSHTTTPASRTRRRFSGSSTAPPPHAITRGCGDAQTSAIARLSRVSGTLLPRRRRRSRRRDGPPSAR